MLRSIGSRPPADGDDASLAGLLADCHERIRRFAAMAATLAASSDAPAADVADTARAIRRYFAEALPLHKADEEESILPRLRGQDVTLDAALAQMHAEHHEHQPLVDAVIAACDAIAAGTAPAALAAPAAALVAATTTHLAAEEATIFPAAAALPADVQATIVTELRARRA